ncbi:hypothetical protein MPER_07030, partial [Moniliophthora perniciosa FA553]
VVSNYESAVYKGFDNVDLAQQFYEECKATGVLQELEAVPHRTEWFVVSQGIKPGVYRRKYVMSVGLGWKGGRVRRILGKKTEADAMLKRMKDNGAVVLLPEHSGLF